MSKQPSATYRIQLRPQFGFAEVRKILPYLAELGVSHIYASPIFKAKPGSEHGYDVCDHRKLNTELGSEEEFEALLNDVKKQGLGWIQDIVPNHMAVTGYNRILVDLLENGEKSKYFNFFDIDWDHPFESIKGRMLAPFLGRFYGETLERGELSLAFDGDGFKVRYYDLMFPISLDSYAMVLMYGMDDLRTVLGRDDPDYIKLQGVLYNIKSLPEVTGDERYDQVHFIKRMLNELYDNSAEIQQYIDDTLAAFNGRTGESEAESGDRWNLLDSLLSRQYFRLSFWKVAGEEINYRRFFSINDLISIRVQEEEVFEHIHKRVFSWIRDEKISGLRIDHIDGLYDPTAYLKRLRAEIGDAYLIVEKILTGDEPLPVFWPIQGTTGYGFMNEISGLFTAEDQEAGFDAAYVSFTGRTQKFENIVSESKRRILNRHMAGDVENLARLVYTVSSKDRNGFDITFNALRQAITELLIAFPVYRTYISNDAFRPMDLTYIRTAVRQIRKVRPELRFELDFLERFLLLEFDEHMSEDDKQQWIRFVMRFQQVTGPLTAKGVEDTTFYIYNRLICLNEVGGEPTVFGKTFEQVHTYFQDRRKNAPLGLNATATHDTKRGEDARIRIAALSFFLDEWRTALKKFRKSNENRRKKSSDGKVPDRNDEYFLYQTLIGSYPFRESEMKDYPDRLKEYLIKAVREAKEHSGWLAPDEEYEQAFIAFAESLLKKSARNSFLKEFQRFQKKVADSGIFCSLSQALIKITAPGVPDFYQGTEFWDLSFVDPDNRRPVDFSKRLRHLTQIKSDFKENPKRLIGRLLKKPEDGVVKLFVIWRALSFRKDRPELFSGGEYLPLEFSGRNSEKVFGFARRHGNRFAIVVIPVHWAHRSEDATPGSDFFAEIKAVWPFPFSGDLLNVFTGQREKAENELSLRRITDTFPLVLLTGEKSNS